MFVCMLCVRHAQQAKPVCASVYLFLCASRKRGKTTCCCHALAPSPLVGLLAEKKPLLQRQAKSPARPAYASASASAFAAASAAGRGSSTFKARKIQSSRLILAAELAWSEITYLCCSGRCCKLALQSYSSSWPAFGEPVNLILNLQ